MPGPIFCSGERVELRTTEREDVEFIQRARTDPAIRTSLGFVRPYNHEQTEEFFENTISADNGDSNFLVCVDGEPIGEANLSASSATTAKSATGSIPTGRARATRRKPFRCSSGTPSTPEDSIACSLESGISTTGHRDSWSD